jgi:hypothetical protein
MIRELPKGRAFRAAELAEAWGFSAEQIEKKAREMNTRRAVEISPDHWEYCILHPDTAAHYG